MSSDVKDINDEVQITSNLSTIYANVNEKPLTTSKSHSEDTVSESSKNRIRVKSLDTGFSSQLVDRCSPLEIQYSSSNETCVQPPNPKYEPYEPSKQRHISQQFPSNFGKGFSSTYKKEDWTPRNENDFSTRKKVASSTRKRDDWPTPKKDDWPIGKENGRSTHNKDNSSTPQER